MSTYHPMVESGKFGNFQIPNCQDVEIRLVENTSWTVFFEGIKINECRMQWKHVYQDHMIYKFRKLKRKIAILRLVVRNRVFACKAELESSDVYRDSLKTSCTLVLHFLLLDKPWQEVLGKKKLGPPKQKGRKD